MTRGARGGARLGVDVGTVRVGVARSDPAGVLAVPVATLARDARGGRDLEELAALAEEHEVVEVVVGLPVGLSGREGAAAAAARGYAAALRERLVARVGDVPVRLVDERLSTVSADRQLADRGVRSRARRAVVDQAAAVAILQSALDRLPADQPPGGADEPPCGAGGAA